MLRRGRLKRLRVPAWLRWGGHLALGAGVGALLGLPFRDSAFGAAAGATAALLLRLYFFLRTQR
ncbi:MAG: hypothetical protein N2507_05315 [Candidatus Bipolaricaulota bacterium]|nr:hypothetical protein [Candidatus Bipolaricaulota bacterium]MCX7844727.1 hypothetical protein [Candidatus Bipolaricaulota bacterium]MDW8152060.1 hypothetical protein [Candidatus Bipolaricaulota bacterium]